MTFYPTWPSLMSEMLWYCPLKGVFANVATNDCNLLFIYLFFVLFVCLFRHKNQAIWDKAVKWIATKESRVRQETRRISGEDLPVWKWICNSDPLPTDVRDINIIKKGPILVSQSK